MHRAKVQQKIRTAKRFGGKYLFNALSVYSSVSRDGSLIHVGRTIYFLKNHNSIKNLRKNTFSLFLIENDKIACLNAGFSQNSYNFAYQNYSHKPMKENCQIRRMSGHNYRIKEPFRDFSSATGCATTTLIVFPSNPTTFAS